MQLPFLGLLVLIFQDNLLNLSLHQVEEHVPLLQLEQALDILKVDELPWESMVACLTLGTGPCDPSSS